MTPEISEIVRELRSATDGWSGDACCVSSEVAERAADALTRISERIAAAEMEAIASKPLYSRRQLEARLADAVEWARAASYCIDRLSLIHKGKPVRDLDEASSAYEVALRKFMQGHGITDDVSGSTEAGNG